MGSAVKSSAVKLEMFVISLAGSSLNNLNSVAAKSSAGIGLLRRISLT